MSDIEVEFVPNGIPVRKESGQVRKSETLVPIYAYALPVFCALLLAIPVAMLLALASAGVAAVVMGAMMSGCFGFFGGLYLAAQGMSARHPSSSNALAKFS